MKSKLTRIWGVVLVVTLLASLFTFATPASAAVNSFSPLGQPSSVFNLISPMTVPVVGVGGPVLAAVASEVNVFAQSADGKVQFIYDNAKRAFFKGPPGFSSTNLGVGLNGSTVVAMAVSPDYATDTTLVAAVTLGPDVGLGQPVVNQVFRSIDAGVNWAQLGTMVVPGASRLTSVDIANWYRGGKAYIAGFASPALAGAGGVVLLTEQTLAWVDQAVPAIPAAGTPDVLAVKFSPNHTGDAEIMAVTVNVLSTYLQTKFGTEAWNSTVVAAPIGDTNLDGLATLGEVGFTRATSAVIAFPSDYDWSGNNRIFVGTAGGANDDAWVVSGGFAGGTSRFTDMNVNGSSSTSAVVALAAKGNYVGAKLLVGTAGSPVVRRATDPSVSTVTFSDSTKNPTGAAVSVLAFSPTTDDAFAGTTGKLSAFSKSTDGGAVWNATGMIEISATRNLYAIDFEAVDSSTMFLLMADNFDGVVASGSLDPGVGTLNDTQILFKSTNGGAAWEAVLWKTSAAAERLTFVAPSPAFATDNTVYVAESGSTRIWKSSNGGSTWIGITAVENITAFYAIDGSSYYTGAAGGHFYKSGRFTTPNIAGAITVNSIAIGKDNAIIVGGRTGSVVRSVDDGRNFSPVGGSDMGGGNNVWVAVDPDGTTLYAGSQGNGTAASAGLYRWTGSTVTWEKIDSGATVATTTTTTVPADTYTATFSAIGDNLDITTTAQVAVAAGAGVTLSIPAANTVRVTSTAAGGTATVTAIVAGANGSATTAVAVTVGTITFTKPAGSDTNGNVILPTNVAIGAAIGTTSNYLLPDLAQTTTIGGTAGVLLATQTVTAPDGTLYIANGSAGAGIRRSVSPKLPVALTNFQSIVQDLSGPLANAQLVNLEFVSGSSKLYAIAAGLTDSPPFFYGNTRIAAFEDALAAAVSTSSPRDGAVLQGTSATFAWTAITSPIGLTYRIQTSTDADFANIKDNVTTIGTSITLTGFTPGTTYWWRVRVDQLGSNLLASKWSNKWTFTPELGVVTAGGQVGGPTLQSPSAGDNTVAQRPTFSWIAVPGAETYELELSTNPFFALATKKGPLSHSTWTWDEDLTYGTTYYWRVRAVKGGTTFSPWAEAVFTVMAEPKPPAPAAPPITIPPPAPQPTPIINLPAPQVTVNIPPPAPVQPSPITPVVIWVIIIIGAVLVIAVIVLIVRTRRVP